MKSIITLFALALTTTLTFAADEAKKPEGEKPKHDLEAVFKKKDANSDGKITKEEFTANAKDADKATKHFEAKDTNKDGSLSKEEFTAPGKKKDA